MSSTSTQPSSLSTVRPVTFAILASGSRGDGFSRRIEQNPTKATVVAVADPIAERRHRIGDRHQVPADRRFVDYQILLAQPKLAQAVINTTMDQLHIDSALKSLSLGYHMLLEKPMAVSLADCIAIDNARRANDCIVTVCHSLRYHPCYAKIKELIDSGAIGKVVSIDQLEGVDPQHQSHSFVRGNWGNESRSTFMLMAKSCHDVDVICYLAGSDCERVSSFGRLSHFNKANQPIGAPKRCIDGCPVSAQCPYDAVRPYSEGKGYARFLGLQHQTAEQRQDFLRTSNYGRCAYDVDNDAVDHQVVAFEFAGGATATFTMTAFAPGGRKLRVHGTHGFIKAKVDENKIELHRFWGEAGHGASNGDTANPYTTVDAVYDKPQQIEVPKAEGGHGGGDPNVIKSLIRAIRTDDRSAVMTGTNESLKTHAVTFAAEMARRQRCVVEVMQLQTAVRAEMAGRAR